MNGYSIALEICIEIEENFHSKVDSSDLKILTLFLHVTQLYLYWQVIVVLRYVLTVN